ncbi:MAG: CRISPR-associated helicase Cas3 [Frankiales bacterium]|nr:CRISPR-associated helicase Cas3 [Frankiales bacterium]
MDDDVQVPLSAAAQSVWAKTLYDRDDQRDMPEWMPLWRHLDDTAAVAGRLWDEWLPASVRRVIAAAVDGDEARARRLAVWLAGVHDVGKATPVFAFQCQPLAAEMTRAGLPVKGPYANRRELRHELAGHVCLVRWLDARHGWADVDAHRLAVVVGGHHGVAPTFQQVLDAPFRTPLIGAGRWTEVQDEYLDRQARFLQDGDLARVVLPSQPAQVLLTAVVIVADWIASNADLFPYTRTENTQARLNRAWRDLNFPSPWRSELGGTDVDELVDRRFGFSGAARPVQARAVEAAASLDEPGLMVIEAPMGEGKTEAALLAAEILAERTGAGGCFIALPTQATTDAMFGRVRDWMDALPAGEARTVFLAHGKASLNDEYQGLMREARVVAIAPDDEGGARPGRRTEAAGFAPRLALTTVVHEWLQGRKKGVLASFVIGTVDQALFAALKSRHLMLRHLALASKVVVIDEVHAYDAYMSSYLDRALHWLGAYGVPVVLLSATLPARRREEMVTAYREGKAAPAGRKQPRQAAVGAVDYPLLTATSGLDEVVRLPMPASGRRSEVRLERLDDDLDTLAAMLEEALTEGGCALVVRNTVTRVQETGRFFAERFGEAAVTVTHARFLAVDRAANDADLLRRFGREGERPRKHIVVGSQVVEQSLDVDFDLLVTDLAPVDLLLQRMGRLHRHERSRPAGVRQPRCVLTGVDWSTTPPLPVRGSRLVYEEEALLRGLAVLRPHLDDEAPVVLPDGIAPLVQVAYGDGAVGPADWQPALAEAHVVAVQHADEARHRAATFRLGTVDRSSGPLLDWVQAGIGEADDGPGGEAQVRDGAMSLEVLVVVRDVDGLVVPPWVTKERELLDTNLEIRGRQARLMASCALRLPPSLSAPGVIDATITDLESQCWVAAWQCSPLLAGQLVLVLDTDGRARVAGRDLHYTREHGLELQRP